MLRKILLVLTIVGHASSFLRPISQLIRTPRIGRRPGIAVLLKVAFFANVLAASPLIDPAGKVDGPPGKEIQGSNDQEGDNKNNHEKAIIADFLDTRTFKQQYNWQEFRPKRGFIRNLRWFITGSSSSFQQSDAKMRKNLASLARMLILLREYEATFGLPNDGGGHDMQRQLLSDITKDLYSSGTPTWVLEPVMTRVAEGLTGEEGIQLLLFPNRGFVFYPSTSSTKEINSGTEMIRMSPGFYMSRLGQVEQVAVRLASFAGNTKSVERLNAASIRMPLKEEFLRARDQELGNHIPSNLRAEELAEEILNLASSTYGLFFFLNSPKFQVAVNATDKTDAMSEIQHDTFWDVGDSTRTLFIRLASMEATRSMHEIRQGERQLYPPATVIMFRVLSAAGACSMWFGGSLPDMIVAGILSVTVSYIGTSKALTFQERILAEVVSSVIVGLVAGLLALKWPSTFCFGSIAIASVMNLMQGFKVVYAVIEVMSKNIVTGTARLLEGVLFTGLMSYSLKFGLDVAFRLVFGPKAPLPQDVSNFLVSTHGISEWFYPLMLPFVAGAWSGLFRPSYADLPLMMMHGILAFSLNWAGVPMFLAAMCVTFSAGIISRFTGREGKSSSVTILRSPCQLHTEPD
jgi:hypothetical protein